MTQQPDAMVAEGLRGRIPGEALDSLEVWCRNERVTIELERFLSGGKTRAEVALVKVYGAKGPGYRRDVLKHCPPPEGSLSLDAAKYIDAKNADQKFARSHLAALNSFIPDGHQGIFLLMEWRGRGERNFLPLTYFLGQESLGAACRAVVKSILVDWQKAWRPQTPGSVTAHEILKVIAGEKCMPGRSLYKIACDLNILEADRLMIDEAEVCNPFFAVSQNKGLAQFRTMGLRGNGHGDLHPGNILVPSTAKPGTANRQFDEYYLIDLSSFDNNRFLAIDPAHFMLSLANERLGELDSQGQDQLRELILDPAEADAGNLPSGLAAAIRAISQVGRDHYGGGAEGLFEDWYQETLLAIAGCALLFVGRNVDFRSRSWYLRLGGMAIDKVNDYVARSTGDQVPSKPQSGNPTVKELVAPDPSTAQQKPVEELKPTSDEHPPGDEQTAEAEPANDSALRHAEDSKLVFISAMARRFDYLRKDCSRFSAELAGAVDDLDEYLDRKQGIPGTSAVRDVLGDLNRSVEALHVWLEESSSRQPLSATSAIAYIDAMLVQATGLARKISEDGSTPRRKAELGQAARQLNGAFQAFFTHIAPDEPPSP